MNIKIIIAIFASLFFYGCSSDFFQNISNNPNQPTNFKSLDYNLTKSICKKIRPNKPLYVVDFVNESNLKNRSKLGFLLSNETKVSILNPMCSKNISIKNISLGKNLKIGENGSSILTRKLKQLKIQSIQDNLQILVGSYVITKKQLIVFLKLVDLNSTNTISSATASTPITNEILDLEGIDTDTTPTIYKPFHL